MNKHLQSGESCASRKEKRQEIFFCLRQFGRVSSRGDHLAFKLFAREFKKWIVLNLPENSELARFNKRYFYVSGFIRRGKQFVYFSIPDVRFSPKGWLEVVLIRTAKHIGDFTGGVNHFCHLKNFKESADRLLNLAGRC